MKHWDAGKLYYLVLQNSSANSISVHDALLETAELTNNDLRLYGGHTLMSWTSISGNPS